MTDAGHELTYVVKLLCDRSSQRVRALEVERSCLISKIELINFFAPGLDTSISRFEVSELDVALRSAYIHLNSVDGSIFASTLELKFFYSKYLFMKNSILI